MGDRRRVPSRFHRPDAVHFSKLESANSGSEDFVLLVEIVDMQ